MNIYGYYQANDTQTLAAYLWGFKFEEHQHWLEYLIEYLNVLVGFEYKLAQGINHDDSNRPDAMKDTTAETMMQYRRFARLGLRRFVFYTANEKNRHPYDDKALELLEQRLRKKTEAMGDSDPLASLKTLLLSFSCVEGNRAWLARSLFPLHENFLFFEGRRKGKDNATEKDLDALSPADMDEGITLGQRNFYGRGGELYYLMLSAGTLDKPRNRTSIAKRFRELLQDSSADMGAIAAFVEDNWQALHQGDGSTAKAPVARAHIGWLPDPDCNLYKIMAEDVKTLLHVAIDPLEKMQLLAYLVAFHMVIYIHHRAHPQATSAVHSAKGQQKCTKVCRLSLLVDASENNPDKTIRKESSKIYESYEGQITNKAEAYLSDLLEQWRAEIAQGASTNPQQSLEEKLFHHFTLRKKDKQKICEALDTITKQSGTLDDHIEQLEKCLQTMLVKEQIRKKFLSVPRQLAKNIGFVSPKQGRSPRFTLSDNLLKVLTLSNVRRSMTYDDFLARLYNRYGLVIDTTAAQESKIYTRININQQYYKTNAALLLERMVNAGLAHQYSDATAMISTHKLVIDDE